jgi:hypothetical protein
MLKPDSIRPAGGGHFQPEPADPSAHQGNTLPEQRVGEIFFVIVYAGIHVIYSAQQNQVWLPRGRGWTY